MQLVEIVRESVDFYSKSFKIDYYETNELKWNVRAAKRNEKISTKLLMEMREIENGRITSWQEAAETKKKESVSSGLLSISINK